MRGSHGSSGVIARAPSCLTELLDYMHANPLDLILAVSDKKLREPLVGNQPTDKVISDRNDGIITAQTFVKSFLLRRAGIAAACRLSRGRQTQNGQETESQGDSLNHFSVVLLSGLIDLWK